MKKFSKYFLGGCLKLNLRFALGNLKLKKNVGVVDVPLVGRHVD